MREPQTREEWAQLLSQRVEESGLSARRFAKEVLRRDERTIRRWQALDSPIPGEVREFLAHPSSAPWPPAEEGDPTAAEMDRLAEWFDHHAPEVLSWLKEDEPATPGMLLRNIGRALRRARPEPR